MARAGSLLVPTVLIVAFAACSSPASLAPPARGIQNATGRLVFHIVVPRRRRDVGHAHFIPASGRSITITLNTVNGGPPPAGLQLTATAALTNCASGCTVIGPASPPGSDNFTVTIFGPAVGNAAPALSTATATFDLVAGRVNTPSITLNGVPAKFALHGAMPSAGGGTALPSTGLPIDVEDAAGDAITGSYALPVTLSDPDASSLMACGGLCGSALALGAGPFAKSVTLTSSSDSGAVAIRYGGLDVAPVALTASTTSGTLAAAGSVTFSPSVPAIAYTGPVNGTIPTIELGTFGPTHVTSVSFTDSQVGWSNAPYGQTIVESDNCDGGGNAIATFAQNNVTNGTAWTATAVASPAVGSCTATLTGGAGATLAVITNYEILP